MDGGTVIFIMFGFGTLSRKITLGWLLSGRSANTVTCGAGMGLLIIADLVCGSLCWIQENRSMNEVKRIIEKITGLETN